MNADYLSNLADCLASNEETTLGVTDSRVAAAALRIVATLADDGMLTTMAVHNSALKQELTVCIGAGEF